MAQTTLLNIDKPGQAEVFPLATIGAALDALDANNGRAHAGNGVSAGIAFASATLTGLSGASVTEAGLVPAGAILLGVAVEVTVEITGATSFDVGDGSTVNAYGDALALTVGTKNAGAISPAALAAAGDVVLTANGSNFTAGEVVVTAAWIDLAIA